LRPGVEYGREADSGTEPPERDLLECLRHGLEEQVVGDGRRGQEDRMKHLGNGEDEVEVRNREQLDLACLDPAGFIETLTLRTMPIAAGVVGNLLVSAVIALPDVPTESGRAAARDRTQHALLTQGQALESTCMLANDVG
jgi:hypothetical protein